MISIRFRYLKIYGYSENPHELETFFKDLKGDLTKTGVHVRGPIYLKKKKIGKYKYLNGMCIVVDITNYGKSIIKKISEVPVPKGIRLKSKEVIEDFVPHSSDRVY